MARSQNGYPANNRRFIKTWTIPGTSRQIALAEGAPGYLLTHFAAWFDKNIESVDGGQLDDWGYAERSIRGSSTTLSNHASGTAIDLNAPRHPLGKRGTFTRRQYRKIRRQLKKYDGCIRWGGDYSGRPDEMHFEIDRPRAQVREVAQRLRREAREGRVSRAAKRVSRKARRRKPVVSLRRMQSVAQTAPWSRNIAPKGEAQADVVKAALKAEGHRNYRQWQVALGFTGKDADGVPGETSLKALGRKHGFRVVR